MASSLLRTSAAPGLCARGNFSSYSRQQNKAGLGTGYHFQHPPLGSHILRGDPMSFLEVPYPPQLCPFQNEHLKQACGGCSGLDHNDLVRETHRILLASFSSQKVSGKMVSMKSRSPPDIRSATASLIFSQPQSCKQ